MNDFARIIEGNRDRTLAAQHCLAPKLFFQRVKMPHAVEQRNDRRLRTDRRRERLNGIVEIERLAA